MGAAYIRRVWDELAEENLLVGVEGVDDEGEQLVDLCLKGEGLRLSCRGDLDSWAPKLWRRPLGLNTWGVFGSRGLRGEGREARGRIVFMWCRSSGMFYMGLKKPGEASVVTNQWPRVRYAWFPLLKKRKKNCSAEHTLSKIKIT